MPGGNPWIFIAIIPAAGLLLYVIWYKVRHHMLWYRAEQRMARLGISGLEADVLRTLAERYAKGRPIEVMRNIRLFEHAVDRHLREQAASDEKGMREIAGKVHALRRHLGFHVPPGARYYSTREVEDGQRLALTFKTDDRELNASARVGSPREDLLYLVELEPPVKAFEGEEAEAYFDRGSRRFRFWTRILEVHREAGWCLAEHTLEIKRSERRRSRRVPIEEPVQFSVRGVPGEPLTGTLLDLSAHGAAVKYPDPIEEGEVLLLNLRPEDYLREPVSEAASQLREQRVAGTVLPLKLDEDEPGTLHLEFQEISPEERDALCRMLNAIELQQRRRAAAE